MGKLALLVVAGLTVSSCQAPTVDVPVGSSLTSPTLTTDVATSSPATSLAVEEVVARVVSVTDGDTVRVIMPDGTNEPVRLIGIDAPEDGSIHADEATAYLETLVLGEQVELVIDVSDRDRFGRLLRYLYVGDLFVNEEMVRSGLAVAKRFAPDTAMATMLEAAQETAEQQAVGLFSPVSTTTTSRSTITTPQTTTTTITTTTTTPPTTTTAPPATTTTGQNCDPAYPTVCYPLPPSG